MEEREIEAWRDFAADLRRRIRWDAEKVEDALQESLGILPGLAEADRESLLQLGRVIAERSSKLAATFLRVGPRGLSLIPPSLRSPWLLWAGELAQASRETLIDFSERSSQILGALPEEELARYLSYGLQLAIRDPAVSFHYFLTLPRIRKEIPENRFALWFEEGFPLLTESPAAALAYFGLESKRSRDTLRENGTSVSLVEISRPLKFFAQALTGRGLALRALAEKEEKQPGLLARMPFTDGETIFLPEAIGDFSTPLLNFLAFKLATAHQAGTVEFGTFHFQLSALHDLFPLEYIRSCLKGISEKGKEISSLEAFFHLFPRRKLSEDLFQILEGTRVDHCLRRDYRGLKAELDFFLPHALENRPALESLPLQEMLLEFILRLTMTGEPPRFPLPLVRHREDLLALISPLRQKGATVNDSARATVILYRWVSGIPNIRIHQLSAEPGEENFPLFNPPGLAEGQGKPFPRFTGTEEPYRETPPPPHWGELRPDRVHKKIRIREVRETLSRMENGIPLSPEALKDLLEKGLEELEVSDGEGEDFQGLFVTDLKGLRKIKALQNVSRHAREKLKGELKSLLEETGGEGEASFFYDEWDYRIGDYRVKWCSLKERELEVGSAEFVDRTLDSYSDLVAEVRRQFQMLKPERFKKIPNLERGEEIDLNAAIESLIDRRAGQAPSEKIYYETNRKDRDFSTVFLLDMSASTDELVEGKEGEKKKVIDIEREALVVMAEALQEIGDEYAMFGFSGYGRKEVDFYVIKEFREAYGLPVKGRVEKVKPQRSTRMGPVIRHAAAKMAGRESKVKNLILISDGYPQDYDYGDDRADKEYALQDTAVALEEAARKKIHVFCITVDRAGHDYLRKMLPPSRYLVIEETAALPRELPKIYRRLTT